MSTTRPPNVLVVDDEPEGQRAVFRLADASSASYSVVHPDEVTIGMLNDADLVLVDYILKSWDTRDGQPQAALQPMNGIALAAVLREHASALNRPTGFAIHTGQPDKLWLTPAETRRHLIARAYNLEWVFLKQESNEIFRHAPILAASVRALPARWPTDDHQKALGNVRSLLGLGREDDTSSPVWAAAAMADVEGCRPPFTELSECNHGLVFLRWLLQRILPYPCFLLDSYRLAARLRITHASLGPALEKGLGDALAPFLYRGVLAGFTGNRWWRAGVENWLWELTEGITLPAVALREKLIKVAGLQLDASRSNSPIICVDQDYRILPESASPEEVLRIQPDDWPGFANQAWTTIELARANPKLAALVVSEDQDKLLGSQGEREDTR